MSYLLDLGNTRAKWARFADGRRGDVEALALDTHEFVDALAAAFGPAAPDARVWLASVAPAPVAEAVEHRLQARGYRCVRVATAAEALGVRIAYAHPERLGVDRFLALLAAHARDDGPWLLVSVGSALTVDLLDAQGRHHGGLIAPTPTHGQQALAARFAVLATAGGQYQDWASDTADAVASGTLASAAGLVERAHRLARDTLGTAPTVLVSGGEAEAVRACLPFASHHVEAPVLDGLARLAAAGAN
jgi:type III pantothenate kinase